MTDADSIVVATRMHLGNSEHPPSKESLDALIRNFSKFAFVSCHAQHAVIAVDSRERIPGYDHVYAVQDAVNRSEIEASNSKVILVLPVTPWDKFLPALNALVSYAAVDCRAGHIMFVSAETSAPEASMNQLRSYMDNQDTLVVGALLPGHDYCGVDSMSTVVPLDGRTTPWNTLALWNIPKLAMTGFPLVSDGLHLNKDGSRGAAGVEEVGAIALLQSVLGTEHAKAKLIRLANVEWDQKFSDDERRKWHEHKMKSKLHRAAKHLELLRMHGTVIHC